MKKLIFFVPIIICQYLFSQNISYNLGILESEDTEIVSLKNFWTLYVNDCTLSYIKNDKDLTLKYWNDEELKDGYSDIVKDILSGLPFYMLGELITFDIKKNESGFFRIRSAVITSDSIGKSVLGIFSVYAKEVDSSYKLYNSFYINKSHFKSYATKHFEFYYPLDYDFNVHKAEESELFYEMFSGIYGFEPEENGVFILGNNIDEANAIIGFDFSIMTSTSRNVGYFLSKQKIIVSCKIDHNHEIVHLIISSKFSDILRLFNEGIATYYGGARGENFEFHVQQMQKIIHTNPNIDLSDFDQWNTKIKNEDITDPYYTIGAAFIDYALKLGGTDKVISLLRNSNSTKDIYSVIHNELDIKRENINSWLRNYFLNYGNE